ncbi:MAG: UDP-N-acetylglucosamine 1-carboxyvinyltransferase [Anaeroplasma sp.]
MNNIRIDKVRYLKGTVSISGSKNATIPILCASLLQKNLVLENVPNILDIKRLIRILKYLGSEIKTKKNKLFINNSNIEYKSLTIEECSLIRGSYYLIPIMLNLFGKCEITLPGGCQIGKRPIDAHLDAIKAFGYSINEESNMLIIKRGNIANNIKYSLIKESVGASINTILLALNCDYAVIDNLTIEPEGLALIEFLKLIGYNIEHFDKKCVLKKGKSINLDVRYRIIPDRMEAMTYIIIGLLCGNLKIKNAEYNHMKYPIDLLVKNGFNIKIYKNNIIAKLSSGNCFSFETKPYPFFPTDMQPLIGVLMAFSKGSCTIIENIFESRMQIYKDLSKAGGSINVIDNKAYVIGSNDYDFIKGNAYDLRQGAALLVASLKIGGIVSNTKIIERGYADIYKKLKKIGVKFTLF